MVHQTPSLNLIHKHPGQNMKEIASKQQGRGDQQQCTKVKMTAAKKRERVLAHIFKTLIHKGIGSLVPLKESYLNLAIKVNWKPIEEIYSEIFVLCVDIDNLYISHVIGEPLKERYTEILVLRVNLY